MNCPKCGNDKTTASAVWQIDDDKTGRLSWCWKCIADEQHDRIALLEARLKDAEEVIETIRFVHDSISNSRDVDAEMEIEALCDMANTYFNRKTSEGRGNNV